MDNRVSGNPGTPAFRVDKYPFYLLNRASSRYNILIDARLRKIGLDIPYWRVLMILGEHAPRSISQIAEAAVINITTMMRIVQRMEKDGLVSSAPGKDDARITEVGLTATGETRLAEARVITAPVYEHVFKGFSERDFNRLTGWLDLIHDNLLTLKD